MDWFGFLEAKELTSKEEVTVLDTAKSLVSEHAKAGTVNLRHILSDALIDARFIRDTKENGKRVWRLMRVIGEVIEPKTGSIGAAAWAATATGAEIKAMLEKARQHRQ